MKVIGWGIVIGVAVVTVMFFIPSPYAPTLREVILAYLGAAAVFALHLAPGIGRDKSDPLGIRDENDQRPR